MYIPNLRTCWICGKEYKYCEKCDPMLSWRTIGCTPKHYQVAVILDEHRNNVLDDIKAKEMFENIGIKTEDDLSQFLPEVAETIKSILSADTVNNTEHITKPKLAKAVKGTEKETN